MRRERAGADERSRGAETKRGAHDATRRDKRGANALAAAPTPPKRSRPASQLLPTGSALLN